MKERSENGVYGQELVKEMVALATTAIPIIDEFERQESEENQLENGD